MTVSEAIKSMKFYKEKLYNGIFNQYISAFDVAIEALEKQIPKKVIQERITEALKPNCCPVCNHRHYEVSVPYCRFCGQALDWSDTE